MVDCDLPVMLHLRHEGRDALCLARLRLEAGRLYATPFRPRHDEQPYRPDVILLEADGLELDAALKRPIYQYRSAVVLP
jgi:hypothetical protein